MNAPRRFALVVAALALFGLRAGAEQAQVPAAPQQESLTITDLVAGVGGEALPGMVCVAHYTGWLYDPHAKDHRGRKFDSSHDRGQAFSFPLGGGLVIKGWDSGLVGMRVARGFTQAARAAVGGVAGCHRVSELLVEVGQAAYQLHFVRFFGSLPAEVRNAPDDPPRRRDAVLAAVPGMRNTCFSYSDANEPLIAERAMPLRLRDQTMPTRTIE